MKKVLLKLAILVVILPLAGCVTPASYNFKIIKPIENVQMNFSDENIDISFQMSETFMKGVDGLQQYTNYDGIAFVLVNKTNEVMTIDWNKISFKDYAGSSGNAVMHKGIKYKDCSSPKTPSTIPPNGKINDMITPCYAVEFVSTKYETTWKVAMLPSPRKTTEIKFGIFMPIQIGDEVFNYEFDFQGTKK